MTERMELYKCTICGNIVEVVFPGAGELVCCAKKMELLSEQTHDGAAEKHLPVITFEGDERKIRVGTIPHPMEEDHFIVFIEAISPDKKYIKRKYLDIGEEPLLEFKCKCDKIIARALCNIHGLWRNENDK